MTMKYFSSLASTSPVHENGRTSGMFKNKQQRLEYLQSVAEAQRERLERRPDNNRPPSPVDCILAAIFNNVLRNGMFSLSQLVGYTQFMVFIIIRVIICGALAGRLFRNDVDNIACDETRSANSTELPDPRLYEPNPHNNTVQIRQTCLTVAYNGAVSPLIAWALTLLTAAIPWILTLPWTPFEIGQDYVRCPLEGCKWPCLTTFISAFIRAATRLLLEIGAFIAIIAVYRMHIPKTVRCYDGAVSCVLPESEEKTCFLWMLTCVNFITGCLSVWEILHMYTHKELYDKDMPDTYTFREIQCNSSYLAPGEPLTPKMPINNGWHGSWEEKVKIEGPSTSGAGTEKTVERNESRVELGMVAAADECLEDPF